MPLLSTFYPLYLLAIPSTVSVLQLKSPQGPKSLTQIFIYHFFSCVSQACGTHTTERRNTPAFAFSFLSSRFLLNNPPFPFCVVYKCICSHCTVMSEELQVCLSFLCVSLCLYFSTFVWFSTGRLVDLLWQKCYVNMLYDDDDDYYNNDDDVTGFIKYRQMLPHHRYLCQRRTLEMMVQGITRSRMYERAKFYYGNVASFGG